MFYYLFTYHRSIKSKNIFFNLRFKNFISVIKSIPKREDTVLIINFSESDHAYVVIYELIT